MHCFTFICSNKVHWFSMFSLNLTYLFTDICFQYHLLYMLVVLMARMFEEFLSHMTTLTFAQWLTMGTYFFVHLCILFNNYSINVLVGLTINADIFVLFHKSKITTFYSLQSRLSAQGHSVKI